MLLDNDDFRRTALAVAIVKQGAAGKVELPRSHIRSLDFASAQADAQTYLELAMGSANHDADETFLWAHQLENAASQAGALVGLAFGIL